MTECKSCFVKRIGRNRRLPTGQYADTKSKAKAKGQDFDLTLEEFTKLRNFSCYYCHLALPCTGAGLDRIDSSRGYSFDNVVPCCTKCNSMKSDLTQDEFLLHIVRIATVTRKLLNEIGPQKPNANEESNTPNDSND